MLLEHSGWHFVHPCPINNQLIRSWLRECIPVIEYPPASVLHVLHGDLRIVALRVLSSLSVPIPWAQKVTDHVHLQLAFPPGGLGTREGSRRTVTTPLRVGQLDRLFSLPFQKLLLILFYLYSRQKRSYCCWIIFQDPWKSNIRRFTKISSWVWLLW